MIEPERVDLFKLPIAVQGVLADYILVSKGLEFEAWRDTFLNGLLVSIRTYILAEEIDCRSKVISIDTVHSVYQNWWEHFKGTIFPRWLKRLSPPKFNYVTITGKKKVTFKRYATYPKANILFPKEIGELIRFKQFIIEEEK